MSEALDRALAAFTADLDRQEAIFLRRWRAHVARYGPGAPRSSDLPNGATSAILGNDNPGQAEAQMGGKGSGNRGHAGRPGKVGGSATGSSNPVSPWSERIGVARMHAWNEVEATSRRWTIGEGKPATPEQVATIESALDAMQKVTPTAMPKQIFVIEDTQDQGFIARYAGHDTILVSQHFFATANDPYTLARYGGLHGILIHEMGHALEDRMTPDERNAYNAIFDRAKDDYRRELADWKASDWTKEADPGPKLFPSLRASDSVYEDLAETYRVHLGIGSDRGYIGPERQRILDDLLRKTGWQT